MQPLSWTYDEDDYMLIDGGITDWGGMVGLRNFVREENAARVINIQVGSFVGSPPGPSSLKYSQNATVVSVSILGLPRCGPWAME